MTNVIGVDDDIFYSRRAMKIHIRNYRCSITGNVEEREISVLRYEFSPEFRNNFYETTNNLKHE